uniref:Interleukin-18-binding protein-like domain-containing protein n=1 Tax=Strigops habroptila TaxID=2489341 RepID=A0A672V361_STRHB
IHIASLLHAHCIPIARSPHPHCTPTAHPLHLHCTPSAPPLHPHCTLDSVTARCEALSTLPELTLIYWLGNGSFVEKLPPAAAAREEPVREEPRGAGVMLRRDLRLEPFSAHHSRTTFSCVVLSPLGAHTTDLRWPPPAPARG